MNNLPTEIIENILLRLPSVVVLQTAKRVCRTWRAVLRNYKFDNNKPGILFALGKFGHDKHGQLFYGDEQEHYNHTNKNYYRSRGTLARMEPHRFSMENLEKDFLVGSCNGLVCIRNRMKQDLGLDSFEIINPLTGEYVLLPGLGRDEGLSYHQIASGFGYCHSTKEYKVVNIYLRESHNYIYDQYVQVYTVGGKQWRYKFIPSSYFFILPLSGVCANGALHWLQSFDKRLPKILAFDLENEEFHTISSPEDVKLRDHVKLFGNLNTCYLAHDDTETYCLNIWGYKKINTNASTSSGMRRSNQKQNCDDKKSWYWIKEFRINYYDWLDFMPFAITRNNQVLLWHNERILCCYDPKTSTQTKLWGENRLKCNYIEGIPHTHSIVSLKDLGEADVRNYYKETVSPTIENKKVKDGGKKCSARKICQTKRC